MTSKMKPTGILLKGSKREMCHVQIDWCVHLTNHCQLSSYCTLVCASKVAEMALFRKQLIDEGNSNRESDDIFR